MTIHIEHPFADPEPDRDPVRRLRGRWGSAVTLWTTGSPDVGRAGLTVSSAMVAAGEPATVLGLVDPDSELGETLSVGTGLVVQLLDGRHRALADAFAGQVPAPGGPFRQARWRQTPWGPVLDDDVSWAGVRVAGEEEIGWSVLVRAEVEHVELGGEADRLLHVRGRYRRLRLDEGDAR